MVNVIDVGDIIKPTQPEKLLKNEHSKIKLHNLLGSGSIPPVVDAVKYMLNATFTTGEIINVDGGKIGAIKQ